MNEDFATYNQAIKLKEFGFNWKCNHFYNEDCDFKNATKYREFNTIDRVGEYISVPTMTQAQKWLREVKKILILIDILSDGPERYYWKLYDSSFCFISASDENFLTYEQALSEGIDKALELLKKE